jgi:hypothetical protein
MKLGCDFFKLQIISLTLLQNFYSTAYYVTVVKITPQQKKHLPFAA